MLVYCPVPSASTNTNRPCLLAVMLFLPSLWLLPETVNAGYSCSRCTSSRSSPTFPAFTCQVPAYLNPNDPMLSDYQTDPFYQGVARPDLPQDKLPCSCPTVDGLPIDDVRVAYYCEYVSPPDPDYPATTAMPSMESENYLVYDQTTFGYCNCAADYPPKVCIPGKCDYAYQCDDQIYICWDGISPSDLGLDEATCQNQQLNNVKYCADQQDHQFLNFVGYECIARDVCEWDNELIGTWIEQFTPGFTPSKTPSDLIDNSAFKCPNGKKITRIIEFCAPSGVTAPDNDCDGVISRECDKAFCQFGDDSWILTETRAPATVNCPENIQQSAPVGSSSVIVNYPAVDTSSLDTCQDGVLQVQSAGIASGELFPVGTTTNTFQDSNGQVTCSFDVTVTSSTAAPTDSPSNPPTGGPTVSPSHPPTGGPTVSPSNPPTGGPTVSPSNPPTGGPTVSPSNPPTGGPTVSPSNPPTGGPTSSLRPSSSPTTVGGPTEGLPIITSLQQWIQDFRNFFFGFLNR